MDLHDTLKDKAYTSEATNEKLASWPFRIGQNKVSTIVLCSSPRSSVISSSKFSPVLQMAHIDAWLAKGFDGAGEAKRSYSSTE